MKAGAMQPGDEPLTHEVKGDPAAPGLASGPLFRLEGLGILPAGKPGRASDSGVEGDQLAQAVEAAKADLAGLAQALDQQGAAIIEFQIAMLEDEALAEPAIEAITKGATASLAWSQAMEAQIADYSGAEDEYFRARAADLVDLRDRVLRHLAGQMEGTIPPGSILVGSDITPSRFLATDWSAGGGIALTAGSAASHVAMLARARGVPMLVGIGSVDLSGHERALLDGDTAILTLSPDAARQGAFEVLCAGQAADQRRDAEFASRPGMTADGTPISVMANVARADDLDTIVEGTCDGIGLMRSEFLFHGQTGLSNEAAQLTAYRMMLSWADGKPVTVRTIDAGGDKPISGLTPEGETNPFLGVRGVRLSLTRPDIFKVQLRALARAAAEGDIRIMLPMVTIAPELAEASRLLDEAVAELKAEGKDGARPQLGIMVEVPAVALAPELLCEADFYSIGSNDLTQYVMASARDNADVAALSDAGHPAILRLIEQTVAYANGAGKAVSLCGDMAGDPAHVEALLRAGLRSLSVAPAAIGRVKAAIAAVDLSA